MTTYYDMTERQAQNVLLHEMIHYSIAYTGLRDTAPHGIIFRGMADKLNRDHGWEIRVMTTTRGWKKAVSATARTPEKPSRYLVLALEMANGDRSEEHTSELQSRQYLVCRLLLEKKNN